MIQNLPLIAVEGVLILIVALIVFKPKKQSR